MQLPLKFGDMNFLPQNDGLIVRCLGSGDSQFGQSYGSLRTCFDQLCLKCSGEISVLIRAVFHDRI